MKFLLALLLCLFAPISIFASADGSVDDLLSLYEKGPYGYSSDHLVLPHLDNRITKAIGYVKYGNYLYMVANTWNDTYTQQKGSYIVRYDVSTRKITKLTPAVFGDVLENVGITYSFNPQSTPTVVALIINSKVSAPKYMYALEEKKTYTVKPTLFKKQGIPSNGILSWNILYNTFNKSSIKINVFTKSKPGTELNSNIEGENTYTYYFDGRK